MSDNRIALVSDEPEGACPYWAKIAESDTAVLKMSFGEELPENIGALVVASANGVPNTTEAKELFSVALNREMPILSLADSMHMLNAALTGKTDIEEGEPTETAKQRVFIAPGSKLAHIIGGSGWLEMPAENCRTLSMAELSPDLMASCYGSNLAVHAFERPGHCWVVGLRWHLLPDNRLPRGFDKIFKVFVDKVNG